MVIVLVILDGWGIGKLDDGNPIHVAEPKNILGLQEHFPFGALKSSGLLAGLSWQEAGGSDSGHLTIGTGRIVGKNEIEKQVVQENPLGKVLANNGKTQLKVAESLKEESVGYFFNGLKKEPFEREFRVILPSQNEMQVKNHPEMRATAITDRVIASLNEGGFDFILANYANPDTLAKTGSFGATKAAIQAVDKEIGRLLENILNQNHIMLITGSHGNAEAVMDQKTGKPETINNPNPVPFYLAGKEFERPREKIRQLAPTGPSGLADYSEIPTIGILTDVAPTILELMNLPIPPEMTGESLLPQLT
ncbi:MAG: hypothetical protein Q8P01_05630 [bacterium]|nr:hypothetical protein [bacterium]